MPPFNFTPDELAAAFGVDSDFAAFKQSATTKMGADGTIDIPLAIQARFAAVNSMHQQLRKVPASDSFAFFEEFASRYLPTVMDVEAYESGPLRLLASISEPAESMTISCILSRLLAVESPMLVRYFRDHSNAEVVSQLVLDRLPHQLPEVPFLTSWEEKEPEKALLYLSDCLCRRLALVQTLLRHSAAVPPARLPADAVSILKRISAFVHVAGPRAETLTLSQAFTRVEDLVEDVLALGRRDEAAIHTDRQPKCRASSQDVCDPSTSAHLLCSRCRAVSYCSPAHQKLDWKQHKKICFAPTW